MAKKLTVKQIENFHRKKKVIATVILKQVKKNKSTVTGARALNKHLPKFLDRHTEDYDVFSKTPRKSAKMLEKTLDKKFKGDVFLVKRAKHPGTYKVVSRVTEKGVADFSKTEKKISTKKVGGINYVRVQFIKKKAKEALSDPQSKFRHPKDRDTLRRLKVKASLKNKPRRKPKVRKKPKIIPRGFGSKFKQVKKKTLTSGLAK